MSGNITPAEGSRSDVFDPRLAAHYYDVLATVGQLRRMAEKRGIVPLLPVAELDAMSTLIETAIEVLQRMKLRPPEVRP